jgi:pimeloyl-ACP methyl ester carboxylesterase
VVAVAELSVGGRSIDYRVVPGDAGKPWLVFLHEGLGCVSLWRDFPDKIARQVGCPALVYSRLGYGRSAPLDCARTPRFMHDEALQVLPEVLRALGIVQPFLIGHSDGASIALIHAGQFPVRGVVAMAPHVMVEDVSVASIEKVRASYMASPELKQRLSKHHDHVDDAFLGWADVWLLPAFRSWQIHAEVGRIAAPVLLIQGMDDEYGTLAQLDGIEQAAGRAAVQRVVLSDCGHSPQRDQPGAVQDAIAAFVRRSVP